jgi:hypothetical protein
MTYARTATIGPAVYKRVTELTAEGKNRREAFQTVAQEKGVNPAMPLRAGPASSLQ